MSPGLGDVWRREAPYVLSALLRRWPDVAAAEDAAQEAMVAAVQQWPSEGVPRDPRAWLIRVASRRLIDAGRADDARARREERVARVAGRATWSDRAADRDDSLQMLLLCCQPAISPGAAVALTLRAVGGLTTRQVASALLIPEATAAQRIHRAKARLRDLGARLEPVSSVDLPDRLHAVRHVLHLIFTAGSSAEGARLIDEDLTGEAIRLTTRLHQALPRDPETAGLLALMLLTQARSAARVDAEGDLVPLTEQDRSRWDRDGIRRATQLLEEALPRGPVGPFQLQAAIAAVHADAASADATDWPQVLELYRMLVAIAPGPAIELAATIALAEVEGPRTGLAALGPLVAARPRDHRVLAAQAHLLERIGDPSARAIYLRAAALTHSIPEQRYLTKRAAGCLG